MTQQPSQSPFARLDTSMIRSTRGQESRNLESDESRKDDPKKTGSQTAKRKAYPQQNYHIHPDVVDLAEAAKKTLRRKHQIKTSKEIIAEEAMRIICEDFEKNKEDSLLVKALQAKILEI